MAVNAFFESLAGAGRLHPKARLSRHRVRVIEDLAYGAGNQRLDIWLRTNLAPGAPTLLFVHGGGFRILSKKTHWLMALLFARAGYVVFTLDYRLAPGHPFPAGLSDVVRGYCWVIDNARRFGADPERLAFAGESAGANLLAGLTLSLCMDRGEPFAREAFQVGVVPRAILPLCGLMQVSEPERYLSKRELPIFVRDRIHAVTRDYLGSFGTRPRKETELADPTRVLLGDEPLARPFPATYVAAGTRDPILDDSTRFAEALAARQIPHELDLYPGEIHAFHALIWRSAAKRCWNAQLNFLDTHLDAAASRAA